MDKICNKCSKPKELNCFYTYSKICKECQKEPAKKLYYEKRKDPEWVEKERKRGREKYHRLNYKSRANRNRKVYEAKPWASKTKNLSRELGLEKGFHAHHWSYNDEHLKDVLILDSRSHYTLHRFIRLDESKLMFRTLNGTLLDTREKHEDFYNKVKDLQ